MHRCHIIGQDAVDTNQGAASSASMSYLSLRGTVPNRWQDGVCILRFPVVSCQSFVNNTELCRRRQLALRRTTAWWPARCVGSRPMHERLLGQGLRTKDFWAKRYARKTFGPRILKKSWKPLRLAAITLRLTAISFAVGRYARQTPSGS